MKSRSLLLVPMAALLATACNEDVNTPVPHDGPAPVWTQLAGGMGESRLNAVWANAPDTVIALGIDRPVYRYDGSTWSTDELPGGESGLWLLWGTSPRNVYAAGANGLAMRYDGTSWSKLPPGPTKDFTDLWGISPTEFFATAPDTFSDAGRVYQYDGTAWTTLPTRFDTSLNALWATGVRNIFVAGGDGYVGRYDGRVWNLLRPMGDAFTWRDAWGAAPGTVFFVGDGGHIAVYASPAATDASSPTTANLRGVFGFSASDVWAVGDEGTLVHFDGSSWSLVPSGTVSTLRAIWGWDGKAIAVGDNGTVLTFDGASWRVLSDGRATVFRDMFGFSDHDVFAVGAAGNFNGVIRHIDGREWKITGEEMLSVWGFAEDDVFAAGKLGAIYHFDGSDWTKMTSGTVAELSGVHGAETASIRRVYAVGDRATLRVWDGTTWGPMIPPSGYVDDLRDVWAAAPDNVFAIGPTGRVLRFRGPVGSLQWTIEETGLTGGGFNAITGRSADFVVTLATDGRVFRYDGVHWQAIATGASEPLLDVSLAEWNTMLVLAGRHSLLSRTRATWREVEIPFFGGMETVWTTRGTTFVAGSQGAIFEYRW